MSGTAGPIGLNQLQRPLGRGMPLPGGDVVDMPQNRMTLPGGGPGGGGSGPERRMTMGNMQQLVAQPSPNAAGPQSTPGGMAPPASLQDQLTSHMKRAKAAFDVTGKAIKQLDLIRKGLERLSDKQDMVTLDDIIHEAGQLVSHGIDPVAMAGVLADAPQEGGGEALGGWVASHAQNAAQAEQGLIAQHEQNTHDMGVAALHSMMAVVTGHGMPDDQQLQQNGLNTPQQAPSSQGNPLAYGARFMQQG